MAKNVNVTKAHDMQSGRRYVYVDVRSEQEYEAGHPAGALSAPLLRADPEGAGLTPNPDFVRVMQANFDTGARLLIGCQAGGRSARAVQILEAAGYTDLANGEGGFRGLRDAVTGAATRVGLLPGCQWRRPPHLR